MQLTKDIIWILATIVTLCGSLVTVTAMFVTIRERVKDHEERLQLHANRITDLDKKAGAAEVSFGIINTKLDTITEKIDKIGC